MKKTITIINSLIAGIILSAIIINDTTEGYCTNRSIGVGSSNLEGPYTIENVWELQNMNLDMNAHYVLKNDINASETRTWNSGAGFKPVGDFPSNPFNGSLDGNGFTIYDLYINQPHKSYFGLFGYISSSGSIYDVNLVDNDLFGRWNVGGLVGYNSGIVINCSLNGSVRCNMNTGGLAGTNTGSISNCYTHGLVHGGGGGLVGENFGTVTNCGAQGIVFGKGGLIGKNYGKVSHSYTTGKVNCMSYPGGLIGLNYGTVSDCHSTGTIEGSIEVGGLIGRNDGRILDCFSTGFVNGTGDHIGGFVGSNIDGKIFDCYSTGNVNGNTSVGGFVGYNTGTISNSHYNVDEVCINGDNYLTIGGLFNDQYKKWLSANMTLDISDYTSVLVPYENRYSINNIQGIKDLLGFAGSKGYRFFLSDDIDLSDSPGLYIPYLGASEFDGNNKSISNIFLDQDFISDVGFIGFNQEGTIKNIHLINAIIQGCENVGGLAGYNSHGSIINCHATSIVDGRETVGGIIGFNSMSKLTDCSVRGNTSGTGSYVGNLAGSNIDGTVSNCHTIGSVIGGNTIGGLIGSNNGGVLNCHATGSASGGYTVGGLVGISSGNVFNCYATGSTNGSSNVGGLLGYHSGIVSNCYSTGNATGTSWFVGGLVGLNYGTIQNCYSTGTSNGYNYIGGFVGEHSQGTISNCCATGDAILKSGSYRSIGSFTGMNDRGKIINCYSIGKIIYNGLKPPSDKGFAGNVTLGGEFEMRGNFWDNQTSLQKTTSGNATGLNTTMMQTRSTYTQAGWDFRNTWCMIEKETYPFLRWQDTEKPVANAGPDQIVSVGAIVEFDGSGSRDDMGIANYTWSFMDGIETLYGMKTSYRFEDIGMYAINLYVRDAVGIWGSDVTNVTVLDNTPPKAEAGPDQIIDEGTEVNLNGTDSSDNGEIVNWTWTFHDGTPVELYGSTPSYRFDNPGIFIITLKVTDETGHWHEDTVTVTVNDKTPPTAIAGLDRTVDQGSVVTLDGSMSSDNVGIIDYFWTFVDDVPVVIHGSIMKHEFMNPGVYVITLNVTDSTGNWHSDKMTLTVRDITPPIANAGDDIIVPSGSTIILNGSLSFDNEGIKNCKWSFSYGGEEQDFDDICFSFTFDIGGVYKILLTVTDQFNNSDEDTAIITVIDTGRVTGIVLGTDWNPVPHVTIKIESSNGKIFTTTTRSDGSFCLEIYHGSFIWNITKEGYMSISGESYVSAMEEITLDLSNHPLIKNPVHDNPDKGFFLTPLTLFSVILLIIVSLIIAVIFQLWKKKRFKECQEKTLIRSLSEKSKT